MGCGASSQSTAAAVPAESSQTNVSPAVHPQSEPTETKQSLALKNVPAVAQHLLDRFHEIQHTTAESWRELDSSALQAIIMAVNKQNATAYDVRGVEHFFSSTNPLIALSYRWSATLGEIYDALSGVCGEDTLVWIDIFFNSQNASLTPEAVLELTPRRYQRAPRHVLLVTESQDLNTLLCRGWITFEIAVRMRSDKPMVELIDPHRKAVELFEANSVQKDYFAAMQTFKEEDKTLIQQAIVDIFSRGHAVVGAEGAQEEFDRGVADFVRLAGGKMLVSDLTKDDNEQWERILDFGWDLADEMDKKGKFKDSLFIAERLLWAAQRKHSGSDHLDVAKSLRRLGRGFINSGDLTSAMDKYSDALRVCQSVPEGNDEEVGHVINGIGVVLGSQGKYEEALEKLEEALDFRRKALGGEHVDVAMSLMNIGNVLCEQGKYEEALEKHEEALEIRRKCLGGQHVDVATSLNNIGVVLCEQGKYEEALDKYKEALEICRKCLGGDHVDVAGKLNNIACVLKSQGKYEEALEKHTEALEICRKCLGGEHVDVAGSLNNIANVLTSQGKYKEALEKDTEALEIKQKCLGGQHVDVATSLFNLGIVLHATGDVAGALQRFQAARDIYLHALGPEHANTKKAQHLCERCRG